MRKKKYQFYLLQDRVRKFQEEEEEKTIQMEGLTEERNRLVAEMESLKQRVDDISRKRSEEAEARQVERALKEKADAQKRQLEAKMEAAGKQMFFFCLSSDS